MSILFLHMTVEVGPTFNHIGFCSWPYGLIKEGQNFFLYTLLQFLQVFFDSDFKYLFKAPIEGGWGVKIG